MCIFGSKSFYELSMKRDNIYSNIEFTTDYSVDEWNALVKLKFSKYFINEDVLNENKEILRTEIPNYLYLIQYPEYYNLFEWGIDLYMNCVNIDKSKAIKIVASLFQETSVTDMKWMTNILIQPDTDYFDERDKVSYYFKVIDEILEGVFKPRFRLFSKMLFFKENLHIVDNYSSDFGKLINDIPNSCKSKIELFLQDPIFSIPTNQWRNIAAHKSYTINKNNIIIEYGRGNIQTETITFEDFYKILEWIKNIYRSIRFSQVVFHLNFTKEIVEELGGTEMMNIRFESSLLYIIHNMQIVGFKFVSTNIDFDLFCLNIEGKKNHDIRSSLIHASQCLDQLSCALYDDKYIRDKFKKCSVNILNKNQEKVASATVSIEIALKKVYGKIELKEYLDNVSFYVKIP